MNYREINNTEIKFLKEMLYEALFVPEGQPSFPLSILNEPEISIYIDNWRQLPNDLAVVVEFNNELIGVIWGRTFQPPNVGFGFINSETPEICMAIKKEFRNKGIGTRLIEEISNRYAEKKIKTISLSVDKLNKAKNLYKRSGFTVIADDGTDLTMKKELK